MRLEARRLGVDLKGEPCPERRRLRRATRRGDGHHRPQRRRQVDPAARAGRPARRRSPARCWPMDGVPCANGSGRALARCARLPAAGAHRALGADRARRGGARAPAASAARRRRERGRRAGHRRRAGGHGRGASRAASRCSRCRAASGRACWWRARWRRSHPRCWPTSRRPASIRRTSWRCSSTSPGSPTAGRTVVVALHDLSLAARFCHRIVLMHGGRVVATGTPQDVLTAEHLAAVYRIDARYATLDGVPIVLP